MIFYIWLSSQSSSPKCSCPARTTKRRFRRLLLLYDNISFCPYYFLSIVTSLCAFWTRSYLNYNLTKDDEPNDRLGIAAALPLHSRFALYKYRLSYSRMPTSTLLLLQKNTAPCGAAHFLRWSSQTLDIYVPVRVSTRIVSPSLTNSGTWSV